jgi:biopolymer transport protein ExbB/TolQ
MGSQMNLLSILENGLFALGQVLRFPIMLLLWVCVGMTLYFAGVSIAVAVRRARERSGFTLKQWLQNGRVIAADEKRRNSLPPNLRLMLTAIQTAASSNSLGHGGLENIVAEHEEKLRHALDGPRALVRVGPSIGLIGTLIPMGSSLAAMASGNLNVMAGQMVVAFTSTIIGLTSGTVAYAIVAMRQGWISAAIREQRYLAEAVAAELEQR